MQELKNWAVMLVFMSVACLIYYFLLPSSSVSETAKAVISVFALTAVLTPVFGLFSADNYSGVSFGDTVPFESSVYSGYFTGKAAEKLEAVIKDVVEKYTACGYKIDSDINIDDNLSINIEHVRIIFDEEIYISDELKNELYNKLGCQPEITVKNEDEQIE